jgi:hypothetical protein
MPRNGQILDPESLAIAANACLAAWDSVEATMIDSKGDVRRTIALRIMDAVAEGERDPERLKQIGLRQIDGSSS